MAVSHAYEGDPIITGIFGNSAHAHINVNRLRPTENPHHEDYIGQNEDVDTLFITAGQTDPTERVTNLIWAGQFNKAIEQIEQQLQSLDSASPERQEAIAEFGLRAAETMKSMGATSEASILLALLEDMGYGTPESDAIRDEIGREKYYDEERRRVSASAHGAEGPHPTLQAMGLAA